MIEFSYVRIFSRLVALKLQEVVIEHISHIRQTNSGACAQRGADSSRSSPIKNVIKFHHVSLDRLSAKKESWMHTQ